MRFTAREWGGSRRRGRGGGGGGRRRGGRGWEDQARGLPGVLWHKGVLWNSRWGAFLLKNKHSATPPLGLPAPFLYLRLYNISPASWEIYFPFFADGCVHKGSCNAMVTYQVCFKKIFFYLNTKIFWKLFCIFRRPKKEDKTLPLSSTGGWARGRLNR